MYEEKARTLHASGCNCCQSVVAAFADQLPISEENARNMAAPFGRGLCGLREVCGCVSGMAMVAGLTGNADKAKEWIEEYRAINGDIVCGRLLQPGRKPCRELVADAARIVQKGLGK